MPHIDVKITTWERYHFDTSSNMNEIIDTIKEERKEFCPYELSDLKGFAEYEKLDETDEYITVEDNNGLATLEVYDDKGELLYHNGTEEY